MGDDMIKYRALQCRVQSIAKCTSTAEENKIEKERLQGRRDTRYMLLLIRIRIVSCGRAGTDLSSQWVTNEVATEYGNAKHWDAHEGMEPMLATNL